MLPRSSHFRSFTQLRHAHKRTPHFAWAYVSGNGVTNWPSFIWRHKSVTPKRAHSVQPEILPATPHIMNNKAARAVAVRRWCSVMLANFCRPLTAYDRPYGPFLAGIESCQTCSLTNIMLISCGRFSTITVFKFYGPKLFARHKWLAGEPQQNKQNSLQSMFDSENPGKHWSAENTRQDLEIVGSWRVRNSFDVMNICLYINIGIFIHGYICYT